jgi:hypothetical protein
MEVENQRRRIETPLLPPKENFTKWKEGIGDLLIWRHGIMRSFITCTLLQA